MSQTGLVSTEQQRAVVRKWLGSGSLNVFGIQFSGKDTQLNRLQAWTGGVILGGGAISRGMMDKLPEHVRKATLSGELIPLHFFLELVTPVFANSEYDGKPLLLSAVGRWHGEEAGITEASGKAGHELKAVIWLELEEDVVWERWRRMRELGDRTVRIDDSEDGLKTRLQWYREHTLPVEDYYRERELLIAVDGSRSPDEVEAEILDGLYRKAVSAQPAE